MTNGTRVFLSITYIFLYIENVESDNVLYACSDCVILTVSVHTVCVCVYACAYVHVADIYVYYTELINNGSCISFYHIWQCLYTCVAMEIECVCVSR